MRFGTTEQTFSVEVAGNLLGPVRASVRRSGDIEAEAEIVAPTGERITIRVAGEWARALLALSQGTYIEIGFVANH